MKALTFKRTALAAALLAAGSVSAATSVSFGIPSTNTGDAINTVTKIADVVAYEELIDKKLAIVAAGEKAFLQITTDGALFENDIITLEFTNSGLTDDTAFVIAAVKTTNNGANEDEVSVAAVGNTILNKEFNPTGTIKKLELRLTDAVADGSTLYIGDAALIGAGATIDWETGIIGGAMGDGLAVEIEKGLAAGAQATVTASIDYVAANLTDITFGATTFATTVTGMTPKFTGAGTKFIDHAADDLELVGGTKAVTASGLSWTAASSVDETKLGLDVDFDGETTSTSVSVGHPADVDDLVYDAKVVLPADCADYLKKDEDGDVTADAVTLGGTNMTKSTTETCTWSATGLTDESGEAIVVNFSGEDVLTNSAAIASFTAKYETVATPALDVSKTLYTLSGDVQTHSDSFATMPYVYSFPGAGAFSYVKVDNSGAASNAKTISLVIDGTIQETVAGSEPMPFVNYFLKDVAPGEISEFTGSEILDALITPRGDAALGYEDEALAGADASKGYHMSVTLRPVSTGATLAGVNFDGVNTSGIGRTPIKFITDTTTLSSVKSAVDTVDTVVDKLDVTSCVAAAEQTYGTAKATFDTALATFQAAKGAGDNSADENTFDTASQAFVTAYGTYTTALDACDD
jgi:hypothetical protein